MTITTNDTRDSYVAIAGQTEFNYTFRIFDANDLLVYVTPVGATPSEDEDLVTNYTVTGVDNPDGGAINFSSGLNSGDIVVILSNIAYDRTIDYQANGDFLPANVNSDIDKTVALIKQIKTEVDRSIKTSVLDTSTSLTLPTPESGQLLRWNGAGTGLENITTSLIYSTVPDGTVVASNLAGLQGASFSESYCLVLSSDSLGDNGGGWFYKDLVDTSSADDGENVIVDALGVRWKREYSSSFINLAALRSAGSKAPTAQVLSGTALGDNLGGLYYRDDSDTSSADDGGSVIVDASSTRWKKVLFEGIDSTDTPRFKNVLINGGFDIWQRGTSQTITASSANNRFYLADRWITTGGAGGCVTDVSRQTFSLGNTLVPGNPTYFMRVDRTTAATGDTGIAAQYVEDVRTHAGKQITCSFYAKADAAKTISLNINQWFDVTNGGSATVVAGTTTFNLTTSWQRYQLTLTLPSIGGKTLGPGHALVMSLFEAAPYSTFTIDIANCQIELGSTATTFEQLDLHEQLLKCQRYYEKSYDMGNSPSLGSTAGMITYTQTGTASVNSHVRFAQRKRAAPTVTLYDPYTGTAGNIAREFNVSPAVAGSASLIGETGCNIGLASAGVDNSRYSYHYTAEAELI